jgi:hypothetical protein
VCVMQSIKPKALSSNPELSLAVSFLICKWASNGSLTPFQDHCSEG